VYCPALLPEILLNQLTIHCKLSGDTAREITLPYDLATWQHKPNNKFLLAGQEQTVFYLFGQERWQMNMFMLQ
jgi:hypothetical protein